MLELRKKGEMMEDISLFPLRLVCPIASGVEGGLKFGRKMLGNSISCLAAAVNLGL